jgi:hypothetical protein
MEFWKIADDYSDSPYLEETNRQLDIHAKEARTVGVKNIINFSLLTSDPWANTQTNIFLDRSGGNLIVDISSFPKRWFFEIIRKCIESKHVSNLVVTYSIPNQYALKQGEDPQSWSYFPGFGENEEMPQKKNFIIAAGFQALSLPEWISDYKESKCHILFPFPSSILGYTRLWDFVRDVDRDINLKSQITYVSGFNLPQIMAKIEKISDSFDDDTQVVFVPYGPKPMSLAFAIRAILDGVPVGYTQPLCYNPLYTSGVKFVDATQTVPLCFAYALKVNGQLLYQ